MSDIVVFAPENEWAGRQKLEDDPAVDVESIANRTNYQFYREAFSTRLAYVRHPHFPRFLIQLGEYNDFVLQDKFNETLRVLTELGASSIRCSSHRERHGRFGVNVAGLGQRGGLGGEKRRASRFDYNFDGSGSAPRDPRPLKWPGEPGLEAAIVGVLRNGASSVRITVKQDDSISMSADIPGRLSRLGVDLGLHVGQNKVDTLEFVAEFPELGRGRLGR